MQVATAVLSVVAKANTKRKLKAGANKAAEHSEEVRGCEGVREYGRYIIGSPKRVTMMCCVFRLASFSRVTLMSFVAVVEMFVWSVYMIRVKSSLTYPLCKGCVLCSPFC